MTMPPNTGPPSWPQTQPAPLPPVSTRKPWIVLGISVAVVVALVVGLLVWRGTSGNYGSGTSEPSSVDEVGLDRTVGLLREKDPVCDDWRSPADDLSAGTAEWNKLDKLAPATSWNEAQRQTFREAGKVISQASERFQSLLPSIRNIGIQELATQAVVYLKHYTDVLDSYVESDRYYASVGINFVNAVTYSCSAAHLVPATDDKASGWVSTVPEPGALDDFMPSADEVCNDYLAVIELQNTVLSGWFETDSTNSAAQWTPEERALNNAVREVLLKDAAHLSQLARAAEGRIVGDLIAFQSAYMKAYANAIPTYTPDDDWLWRVSTGVGGGLGAACKAHR